MYYFIVNPASRTGMGLTVWDGVRRELERRKVKYEVHFTKYPKHSIEITKGLCDRIKEPFTLAVLGGDGTANEVLASITDISKVTFVYIPSGSSNDLARGLGISSDPVTVVDHLLSGDHIISMDYGNITLDGNAPDDKERPHRFAVSAGIGFDASVCEEALNSPIKLFLNKIKLGKLSYLVIAVKQLIACPTVDMTIQIDGQAPKQYKQVFFAAAMNQPNEGGGLKVAPKADPTDRKLSVCIIHNFPKIKAILIIPALLFGKHTLFKGVDIVNCNTVDIRTKEPMPIHSDGESRGRHTHVIFSCSKDQMKMSI